MILSIVIPKNTETHERCEDSVKMYALLLFTHLAILFAKLFGDAYGLKYNKLFKTFLILCVFLQLLTMNLVLGNWVYDQRDPNDLEEMRGKDWERADDWI